MVYGILVLFTMAAALGVFILIRWLADKSASRMVILSHGAVAVSALVLLILFSIQQKGSFPGISITLFVCSAATGMYLFARDTIQKTSPMSVVIIHAILAAGGIAALLLFALIGY